jgi:hypothetical protein
MELTRIRWFEEPAAPLVYPGEDDFDRVDDLDVAIVLDRWQTECANSDQVFDAHETDDTSATWRSLWVRTADVRAGFVVEVGRYAVVGDDDADPKVARIVEIGSDGNLLLEVLTGPVEAHRDVLARA